MKLPCITGKSVNRPFLNILGQVPHIQLTLHHTRQDDSNQLLLLLRRVRTWLAQQGASRFFMSCLARSWWDLAIESHRVVAS